jgi:nucleoside-diphosphate-sugar epimerase
VYVADICAVLAALLQRPPPGPRTYNMGGPQRLSRADMARAVAAARGLPEGSIVAAPAASVQRGVASPADISMDSARLAADTGVASTLFADALARIPEWHPAAES